MIEDRVLSVLINGLWLSAIAAGLVGIALRLTTRHSALFRYRLLRTGFACAVLAPLVVTIPTRDLRTRRAVAPVTAVPVPVRAEISSPVTDADAAGVPEVVEEEAEPATPVLPAFHVASWVFGVYLALAVIALASLAGAVVRVRSLKRRTQPVPAWIERVVAELRDRHDVNRDVRVAASAEISTPAFVGFTRPMLLFPQRDLHDVPRAELALAAAHELAHADRHDDWWTLVEHVVAAALFFNPAIAWMSRRMAVYREMACDEWVVSRTGVDPASYAETLFSVARRAREFPRQRAMVHALAGSSLRQRIDVLTSPRFAQRIVGRGRWSFVPALVVVVMASVAFRAPAVAVVVGTDRARTPATTAAVGFDRGEAVARLDRVASLLEAAGRSGALLVAVDGHVLLRRGFGVSDRRVRTQVSANTRFNAGALAKMLTAAAILQLERDGKLRRHDPLSRWIGKLPAPKSRATIHHLLVHTGGLAPPSPAVFREDRGEFMDAVRRAPADFEPGTRRRYTDIGYSVLAAIVELASGLPYETYVRTKLLEPAGMRDTWFESEALSRAAATEYSNPDNPRSAVGPRPYVWGRRGGMGITSTVDDLFRWYTAIDSGLAGKANHAVIFGNERDAARNVMVGYGWEIASSDRGTSVRRFLSGWPGNSVELMNERETGTTIAMIFDSRVNWDHPRYNEVARVLAGEAPEAAVARMLASTPAQ